MSFRLWSKRDPLVKTVRPLVDPRIHETDPNIERVYDERVAANKARRAARKQTEQKINEIAAEYA